MQHNITLLDQPWERPVWPTELQENRMASLISPSFRQRILDRPNSSTNINVCGVKMRRGQGKHNAGPTPHYEYMTKDSAQNPILATKVVLWKSLAQLIQEHGSLHRQQFSTGLTFPGNEEQSLKARWHPILDLKFWASE